MKITSWHTRIYVVDDHVGICLVRSCIPSPLVPGLQITSGPEDKFYVYGFRATNLVARDECKRILKDIKASGVTIQKAPLSK